MVKNNSQVQAHILNQIADIIDTHKEELALIGSVDNGKPIHETLHKVSMLCLEDTQMGSQIDEKQLNKILDYVNIGRQEGAQILCSGERITESELKKVFLCIQPYLEKLKTICAFVKKRSLSL